MMIFKVSYCLQWYGMPFVEVIIWAKVNYLCDMSILPKCICNMGRFTCDMLNFINFMYKFICNNAVFDMCYVQFDTQMSHFINDISPSSSSVSDSIHDVFKNPCGMLQFIYNMGKNSTLCVNVLLHAVGYIIQANSCVACMVWAVSLFDLKHLNKGFKVQ